LEGRNHGDLQLVFGVDAHARVVHVPALLEENVVDFTCQVLHRFDSGLFLARGLQFADEVAVFVQVEGAGVV